MKTEIALFRRRMVELEPLAYIYERHGHEIYKICYELYREYKSMYETLLKAA